MDDRNIEERVPGIHQGCDRWCDRCHAARRCALYREGRARLGSLDAVELDIDRMVRRALGKAGRIESAGAAGSLLEEDPLVAAALELLRRTVAWLCDNADRLYRAVADRDDPARSARLSEALEEIGWYSSLVPSRLARAIHENREAAARRCLDGHVEEALARERALLAMKVALEASDRLRAAWEVVGPAGRVPEEAVIFITSLRELERAGEELMPAARRLRRPGLDPWRSPISGRALLTE